MISAEFQREQIQTPLMICGKEAKRLHFAMLCPRYQFRISHR
jgi:hypothetical protein